MLSLTSALYFDRDIEETIPVSTYVFMLLLYLAGICGIISHAAQFLLLYLFAGTVFFLFLSYASHKRNRLRIFSVPIILQKVNDFLAISLYYFE